MYYVYEGQAYYGCYESLPAWEAVRANVGVPLNGTREFSVLFEDTSPMDEGLAASAAALDQLDAAKHIPWPVRREYDRSLRGAHSALADYRRLIGVRLGLGLRPDPDGHVGHVGHVRREIAAVEALLAAWKKNAA